MVAARSVSELTCPISSHRHMTQGGGCCSGRAWTTTRRRSCSRRCTSTWMYVLGLLYAFIKSGRPWGPARSRSRLTRSIHHNFYDPHHRYDQMCAANQTSEQATKRGAGWEAAAGVDQTGCVFVAAVSKVAVNPPTTTQGGASGGVRIRARHIFLFQVHGCVCGCVCARVDAGPCCPVD